MKQAYTPIGSKPLVSIITVTLNSAEHLETAVQSVIEQSYPNIEYIIVDGGSTDGTLDIVKKYGNRVTKWVSEPDKGIYDAMNKGIKLASGELIGILNSDDWYEKDTVQTVVDISLLHPDYGLFHGDLLFWSEDLKPLYTLKPDISFKEIWNKMPVNHPTCFVRKEIYEKMGNFTLKYKIANDYDLILRLFVNGVKFKYIDRKLTNMRTGGLSMVGEESSWFEIRDITIQHGLSPVKAYLNLFIKLVKRKSRKLIESLGMGSIVTLKRMIFRDKRQET